MQTCEKMSDSEGENTVICSPITDKTAACISYIQNEWVPLVSGVARIFFFKITRKYLISIKS